MLHFQAMLAGIICSLFLVKTATAIPAPSQLLRRADDVCSPGDRTYSTQVMPAGHYMDLKMVPLTKIGFPATQYVTVVNLTPHRFILDRSRTHSTQMDTFDWDDVPQGKARQNTAKYTSNIFKNPSKDNGEAYYTIDGTSKSFVVRKTAKVGDDYARRTTFDLSGMGLGQREYLDPGKDTAVTLIITGSESYGFQASINHGQGNWMKGIYDTIKDRQIRNIVMPGSHDAGMSKISNAIKSIGSQRNTQTQGLNTYDQLRVGARYFDLRLTSVHKITDRNSYSFWTTHVDDERAKIVVGNTGESLDEVIAGINQFTAESPGEVIFFRVRYLIGLLEVPADGPIYWTADIMNNFFSKLRGVNNRCANLDSQTPFEMQTASYFMDQNNGNGCVLFVLENKNIQTGVPSESPADGIYPQTLFNVEGHASNKATPDTLANDQFAFWKTISRTGNQDGSRFLIGQWGLSINAVETTLLGLDKIALLPGNPAFFWSGINGMSPEVFPTVVWMDYIGLYLPDHTSWDWTSAELYTWAVGMNLYMVSENCDINKRRSPLLPNSANGSLQVKRDSSLPHQKRVTYADGTVLDNPSDDLHLGRVSILTRGTVFANGTIVERDMPNYL